MPPTLMLSGGGKKWTLTRRVNPGRFVAAAAVVALTACSVPEPEIIPGVSRELARYRAATVSGLHYALDFVVPEQPDADIEGHVVIAFDLLDATMALALDFTGGANRVHAVSSNGEPADWRVEREHIVIPAAALAQGRNEVQIEFVAGSASLNRNPDYLYSLFVPDRARTAFPLFDQPDLKATFDLTLTVPTGWRALSNASVESVSPNGSSTTHRFRRSALISPYVFAFVAGEFESVTRARNGRSMTMLHRETDAAKVDRNVEAIFDLHAAAVDWLEDYTGIEYPFEKLDFALIPAFQYGGMEHAGAIFYRARSLLLDEAPSDMDLLGRASLIAHETAHMWFGNLVTMEWFDDVWLKEVFANFMAARIVNPSFPEINHELNFLVRHAPAAYSVDRTAGANPIRQPLANLNEAGQLYGPIIYNKAPIMMRQLESLVGEEPFQAGLRQYLDRYAFANATWPDLIDILDATTDDDLRAWSEVWVNTPGRPVLQRQSEQPSAGDAGPVLLQNDPAGSGRVWPQRFGVAVMADAAPRQASVLSSSRSTPVDALASNGGERLLFNSDGHGYGLFPADADNLLAWDMLGEVERAAELINLYENMLTGGEPAPGDYFTALLGIVERETNQLLLGLALDQLTTIYWNLLPIEARLNEAAELETTLWQSMLDQTEASSRKVRFDAFADIATTPEALRNLHDIWSGTVSIENLPLSENDRIALAQSLAIRLPAEAGTIFAAQLARTENPDNRRRLEFIAPSLSADESVRDAFFASLEQVRQREVEPWVLEALENLHHPLRIEQSENYVLPSLELLEQIQATGDIFFPSRWLDATLSNHRSVSAVATVNDFLAARPDYNAQLRAKILQAADPLFRANALTATGSEPVPLR
ncbi:MAG: M1 family aminopeptidase [Rhodospirillaceae bacterium]|nr:M1 family aminopeptidase [Rhodospirillaceae bacterium]